MVHTGSKDIHTGSKDIHANIPNMGNTCWMNAIVQILSRTPEFLEVLSYIIDRNNTQYTYNQESGKFLKSFYDLAVKLIHGYILNDDKELSDFVVSLNNQMRKFDNVGDGSQRDSSEFFTMVMGVIPDEDHDGYTRNDLINSNILKTLFSLVTIQYGKCIHGLNESNPYVVNYGVNPVLELDHPIDSGVGIVSDILKHKFDISDDFLGTCSKEVDIAAYTGIGARGQHRGTINEDTGTSYKINKEGAEDETLSKENILLSSSRTFKSGEEIVEGIGEVEYTHLRLSTINIPPIICIQSKGACQIKLEWILDLTKWFVSSTGENVSEKSCLYELYGLCCTNKRGGHYWAICKTDDQWFIYDDNHYSRNKNAKTTNENLIQNRKYFFRMLFYRKVDESRERLVKDNIAKGKDISRQQKLWRMAKTIANSGIIEKLINYTNHVKVGIVGLFLISSGIILLSTPLAIQSAATLAGKVLISLGVISTMPVIGKVIKYMKSSHQQQQQQQQLPADNVRIHARAVSHGGCDIGCGVDTKRKRKTKRKTKLKRKRRTKKRTKRKTN